MALWKGTCLHSGGTGLHPKYHKTQHKENSKKIRTKTKQTVKSTPLFCLLKYHRVKPTFCFLSVPILIAHCLPFAFSTTQHTYLPPSHLSSHTLPTFPLLTHVFTMSRQGGPLVSLQCSNKFLTEWTEPKANKLVCHQRVSLSQYNFTFSHLHKRIREEPRISFPARCLICSNFFNSLTL